MNEQLLDLGLLLMSILIFIWYRWYTKNHGGLRSSISASAMDLKNEGKQFYTHLFIIGGLTFPLAYIMQNYFTIISAGLLSTIGLITGYNAYLKPNKLQDYFHIVFTNISILGFIIGLILINRWYSIGVGIVFCLSMYLFLKKEDDHTRKIEYLIIYLAWVCGIIDIILKL